MIHNTTVSEAINQSKRTGKLAVLPTRGPARVTHENELRALATSETWSAYASAFTFVGDGWAVKLS